MMLKSGSNRPWVAVLFLLIACGPGERAALGEQAVEVRIRELVKVLRDVTPAPAKDSHEAHQERAAFDQRKNRAGIELGQIGLKHPLPADAVAALCEAAKDNTSYKAHADVLDDAGGMGYEDEWRAGDGAQIALLELDLARIARDLERMQFLCRVACDLQRSQAVRFFAAYRLDEFHTDAVVPYLQALSFCNDQEFKPARKGTVLQLAKFLPFAADSFLLLTSAVPTFISPPEWDLPLLPERILRDLGRPRHRTFIPVRLKGLDEIKPVKKLKTVRLEVRPEESLIDPRPLCDQVRRITREFFERLGVTVLKENDGGPEDLTVRISVLPQGPCCDLPACQIEQIVGKIEFHVGRTTYTKSYESIGGGVSWKEVFAGQSGFFYTLAGMTAAVADRDVMDVMGVLANDPDWRVQLAVAWTVSDVRDPCAVDGLLFLFQKHESWLIRVAAADAVNEMAKTTREKLHPHLTFGAINTIMLSRNQHWMARWAALRLMGTLCASTDCSQMDVYLFAGTWLERREAAMALGRVGGRDMLVQLRKVVNTDTDGRVRDEAGKAIEAIQRRCSGPGSM